MTLEFSKYQGTGNDFIMINEADLSGIDLSKILIQRLCERRFGIGADGLIVIRKHKQLDFYVDYFNADGSQSFCGNGARCSVKFAQEIGLIQNFTHFEAIDGPHEASIHADGSVKLRMSDVPGYFIEDEQTFILDTGSPHYVKFLKNLSDLDIVEFGKSIRYSPRFEKEGINVNICEFKDDILLVQTYERGVENETFSCGTGVTAVALAAALSEEQYSGISKIQTKGGNLKVYWNKNESGFEAIYLEGPAEKVYHGSVEL